MTDCELNEGNIAMMMVSRAFVRCYQLEQASKDCAFIIFFQQIATLQLL
jgi:hypothetical protein